MQIGFTSTTFKGLAPEEIIALAAQAKADCIEWSDLHIFCPEKAKEVKTLCDAAGIQCCSLGSYYHVGDADRSRWEHICQTAAAMGAGFIRVWLGRRGSDQTSEKEYAALLLDAKHMARAAKSHGLFVAAEAHPNTYNDCCETSLRFLKQLDDPDFGTYFQSLYKDMSCDLDRLSKTWPWLRAVHVSFSEVQRNRRFMPKEDDCVERVVQVLRKREFGGPVLLEFCKSGNPQAFLKDMERLRALT